jgi:two-component system cell cycle response regulator
MIKAHYGFPVTGTAFAGNAMSGVLSNLSGGHRRRLFFFGDSNMRKNGTFAVMLWGLKESESRMVKSLCMLSNNRSRSYEIAPPMDMDQADVWLIDGTNEGAVKSLRAAQSKRRTPAIVIAAATPSAEYDIHIEQPVVASRLLGTLDLLVTKELSYFPELVIGANRVNSPSSADGQFADALHGTSYFSHYTALVVDDSVTIRKQVELALRLHDVEAICTDTGESAMVLLATQSFDLIFLDVMLPGGADGYQICRSIKKLSMHKKTPVIMLTGRSSPFDRVRGSLAGCNTYLTKPVENDTFKAVLKKYLKAPKLAHAS